MPILLPDGATAASRLRAELALELAESCPVALADEIALTGSTAHGFSDDQSDLELNLWSEAIPPGVERVGWLQAVDADAVTVEENPRSDSSYWIHFLYKGIPAEIGWQTFTAVRERIDFVRSGTVIERKTLTFAEIIVSAIPLRTGGQIAVWQALLNAVSGCGAAKADRGGSRALVAARSRGGDAAAGASRRAAGTD